mgnify:CR=1 FL=1
MNIAIDIDDTLTNSFEYFQPYVAEFFGTTVDYLREECFSYGNLPPEWKARELEFCRKYYDKTAEFTPFKPYACEAVKKFRNAGHKIFIITARTTDFYTDPYETTRRELENGGIEYDKLICTTEKGSACEAEKISLLIDDMPKNCENALKRGMHAILFTSPANERLETSLERAGDWKELAGRLLNAEQNG